MQKNWKEERREDCARQPKKAAYNEKLEKKTTRSPPTPELGPQCIQKQEKKHPVKHISSGVTSRRNTLSIGIHLFEHFMPGWQGARRRHKRCLAQST
eukprot:32224-Pelagomonas_calceolata.AAC.1